ncbi:MAG: keto-hydroxyglutarate-aldolase/keto-deoxy-phosphogluconate aldolase, partial [Eubacteriales bacterium]
MNDILKKVGLFGIVPVVKIENADDAEPLAKALIAGGLPLAEITFRTDAAAESIARITKAYPDMLVGAGTVLT